MRNIVKLQSAQFAVLLLGAAFLGGPAAADQVIPDDLIVQGSTCTGFGCVNGESFGFDTLRLKEDNLRIGFDDASTSAGFPANDWQITANDSANGGASYLAFDDITGARQPFRVTAGAPTSSLFVSSNGNVGFGTAAPALDLSMNTSDSPAVRFEQNNSGGFTAQTWDIGANEANFFVRDVTGGSRLSFRIRPGAPTSSLDIAANGNVGIGTASPSSSLHVRGPTNATVTLQNGAAGGNAVVNVIGGDAGLLVRQNGADVFAIRTAGNVGIGTTAPAAQLHTTGAVRFAGVANCAAGIKSDAAGTLSCITSSRRFKTLAGHLLPDVALANVMALRPQVGTYNETPDVPEHWLIAEEAAEVDPAFVGLRNGEPYTVKTQNVVADLIAVVQQQQRRIEELERLIARR